MLKSYFTSRVLGAISLALALLVNPASSVQTPSAMLALPAYRAAAGDTTHLIYLPLAFKSRTEWTLHKTPDGLHPDGNEQQMVWLMNRARANPAQEGRWLATTNEDTIAGPRDYFGVDLNVLQSEFSSYAVKPPAAFDARMYNGSKAHSDDLIARDAQDHNGQFQQIADAGFSCWGGRANVFSYADSALNAHAAFNIDWGNTADGMQTGRGHRMAIMSVDGNYTNVGIAMVPAPGGLQVGPLVTSSAYCYADESKTDHFNRFIVGTVWQDSNANGRYDPGEGFDRVSVTPDAGKYFAVTAVSGGYAIPIEEPGAYVLDFSGVVSGQMHVTVGETSVLADLLVPARVGNTQADSQPGAPHPSLIPPPPPVIMLP